MSAASPAHDIEASPTPKETQVESPKLDEKMQDTPEGKRLSTSTDARTDLTDHKREIKRGNDFKGWALVGLSFSAIGVTYSDIGTSPLYVLNGIFPSSGDAPDKEDVIGVISLIFWMFTIVVIIKYCIFILDFGTLAGEGGTFALYQGLYPPPADDTDMSTGEGLARTLSFYPATSVSGVRGPADSVSTDRRESILAKPWLKTVACAWALWGAGLTLSDGILTPAVSVVSAAEGIQIVKPNVESFPVAIGILAFVILIQPLGVHRLSFLFSPLVVLWLAFLAITGIYNIVAEPEIFRAFDPSRFILYFVRTRDFSAVAGALLAVTGCEATFANLGQFNRTAITAPLILLVYPCLMLAYFGQGAKMISDPAVISNVFYMTIPGPTGGAIYYIGLVLGILATIIASQAMLSGAFSIVSQLVHMRCLPAVKTYFPSVHHAGQVYQHVTNWLFAIAILGVVGGFQESSHLTNAYGFAVATVMLTSTSLVALQIYFVRRRPWFLALAFFVVFGFVDGTMWASSIRKVPEGAWFSLGLGTIIAAFAIFWTWCNGLVDGFDSRNRRALSQLVEQTGETNGDATSMTLKTVSGEIVPLQRMSNTMTIFWKPSGGAGVPHTFSAFLSKLPALPSLVVFMSIRELPLPHVPIEEQLLVDRKRSHSGFFTAVLRLGYKDHLNLRQTEDRLMMHIVDLETRAATCGSTAVKEGSNSSLEASLRAAGHIRSHIWPSYYMVSNKSSYTQDSFATAADWKKLLQPKVLGHTAVDGMRSFLIGGLYRRLKGAFADEEGPFDSSEEVIRILIKAQV